MVTVIGITGGIGAGKSSASAILGELGAEVIDADKAAHQVYLPNTPAWREIVEAFGEEPAFGNPSNACAAGDGQYFRQHSAS